MARRPPAPSPLAVALERLARLAGTGTAPDRMVREAQAIVADWRTEPELDAGALRERLESLRDDVAAGISSAEEQAGDVDQSDKSAVRRAEASLAGLRAVGEAMEQELGR